MEKGKKFATIKYDFEYNKERVMTLLETVHSFLETFVKNDIPVQEEIWNAAKNELASYGFHQKEGRPKIQFIEEFKLRIIWRNTAGIDHKNIIEGKLLELSKKAAYGSHEITRYEKAYIALLKKMAFVENSVKPKCKDVQVDYDEENSKVTMKGPLHQLKIAEDIFWEQEFATTERSINLPQNVLKFLKTEGKDAIEMVLKDYQCSVIKFQHFEDQVITTILGNHDKGLIQAISGIAAEETVEVKEYDITLKSRPEWIKLCQDVREKNGVIIRDERSSVTRVIGFAAAVEKAVTELKDFVDTNLMRTEYLICQSSDVKQYIRQIRGDELRSIEKEHSQDEVKILDDEGEDDTFCISGRGDGLREAKNELAKIIDKTAASIFTIEQPGLRKTFERGRGDDLRKLVGAEHKCVIQIEENFVQNHGGSIFAGSTQPSMSLDDGGSDSTPAQFVTPQGQRISRKIGNIALEQVHSIVIPEGECFDAIKNFNPGITHRFGNLQFGDISAASVFNSSFQFVIYTRCRDWSFGLGEKVLRDIVRKSLENVVKMGGDSIAFPVIGTGKLNFPPKEACRTMLDETLVFCQDNPRQPLDIRFIAFHHNQSTIEALRQEMITIRSGEEKRRFSAEVLSGNLIYENTDAIVNVLCSDMDMNKAGKLSRDLAHACGRRVQQECSRLGWQKEGSAVITSGGNLAARHIIHLIPKIGSRDSFIMCLENCLQLAESRGLRSISLPAVGTGDGGMSARASASAIFQVLNRFGRRLSHVRHVRIVILRPRMLQPFQQEKKNHSAPSMTSPMASFAYAKRSSKVGVEIVNGDLIHENTDAIVNTINTDMEMRNAGQLSNLIANASGQGVENECRRLAPQPGGSAMITSGGNLRTRHIIHLVLNSSDRQHLQKCLEEGLRLADRKGLKTISVPAIGTGGHGLSATNSASMIFQAVQNVSKDCVNVGKVRIVVKQVEMMTAFNKEQGRQQNVCRDRFTTQAKHSIRVSVTGSDVENISKATEKLKSCFSGEVSSSKVKDEGISTLSQTQVQELLEQANKCDIEMTFDAPRNRIDVRGDIVEMPKMVENIYRVIGQRKKQLEEEQKHQHAEMISKLVEWTYELNGRKDKFDLKTNYEIEMAENKGLPNVKVRFLNDEFDIDLKAKTGYGQLRGEQLTVTRKLAEDVALPNHWSPMPSDDVLCVPLATNSQEYQKVSDKFYQTANRSLVITKIARVQKPSLYRIYMVRKQKMDSESGRDCERQLFHGTSSKCTNQINEQGFNRTFCGEHGTKYGQGTYFARDASYSRSYTDPKDAEKCMYLAKVLVWRFCQGTPDMKTPPSINEWRKEILYDSTVDKPVNPTIFVVFSDYQSYPEYLINFH